MYPLIFSVFIQNYGHAEYVKYIYGWCLMMTSCYVFIQETSQVLQRVEDLLPTDQMQGMEISSSIMRSEDAFQSRCVLRPRIDQEGKRGHIDDDE